MTVRPPICRLSCRLRTYLSVAASDAGLNPSSGHESVYLPEVRDYLGRFRHGRGLGRPSSWPYVNKASST